MATSTNPIRTWTLSLVLNTLDSFKKDNPYGENDSLIAELEGEFNRRLEACIASRANT